MKRLLGILAILLLSLSAQAQDNLLTSTLRSFGLDSASIGFRPQPAWGTVDRGDPFRLPFFDGLLARPLAIPGTTRDMLGRYRIWITADSANFPSPRLAGVRPLAALVMNSARNLGYDIGRYGFEYTPAVPEKDALLAVLRSLYDERGYQHGSTIVYPLPTQNWSDAPARAAAQLRDMPADLQRSIAVLLAAIRDAAAWRDRSLQRIPESQWRHIFRSTTLEESQCDALTFDQTVYDAALAFDGATAHYGAMLLAQAVETTLPALLAHRGERFHCDFPTPLGRIVIAGGEASTHYTGDCALLIDLGGDDTYLGATGCSSPDLPVSVTIDLDGNDSYRNEHDGLPSQGAGVLGFGFLLDLAGKDSYTSGTFSQGCGRFGVGVLYDAEGDDTYASTGFSQGAGLYGTGILFDRSGNDAYTTVYYAQGYGFSRGLGLLADAAGNDTYLARDDELTHVGDETPKHNESDAQGYGAGRRGDHTDGHNMSGGLGILFDLAGDDSYSAGVFAQGSGYWYGFGILNDAAGDDRYRGVFFNLGAAAHFAIGVLFDDRGDDRTDLVMTLGLGTAHDASAAFYLDGDGDDTYTMSDGDDRACSLGTALNNSFALFANVRGNDSYAPVGNAFGYATSRRGGEWTTYAPSTGLFFDIGGTDTYAPAPREKAAAGDAASPRNNATWHTVEPRRTPGVNTTGVDTESGILRFEQ